MTLGLLAVYERFLRHKRSFRAENVRSAALGVQSMEYSQRATQRSNADRTRFPEWPLQMSVCKAPEINCNHFAFLSTL